MGPFKGVGEGQWGYPRYSYSKVTTHRVLRLVNLKNGHNFRDVYTLALRGVVAGLC